MQKFRSKLVVTTDYVEEELAGNNNRNTIWILKLSVLALITTFQQNYHNFTL